MVAWNIGRLLDQVLPVPDGLRSGQLTCPRAMSRQQQWQQGRGRCGSASARASPGGNGAVTDKIEPIDNKIEQAMDLVKSHLLLAVREEVDVLKASITKLVDKITVLERENEVLKTNATPEMLAQLDVQAGTPQQQQQQQQQTSAAATHTAAQSAAQTNVQAGSQSSTRPSAQHTPQQSQQPAVAPSPSAASAPQQPAAPAPQQPAAPAPQQPAAPAPQQPAAP